MGGQNIERNTDYKAQYDFPVQMAGEFVLLVRFFFLIAKFFLPQYVYPLAKNKYDFHTMFTLNLSCVILTKIDTCLKYSLVMKPF
jgi:hypothetical protein